MRRRLVSALLALVLLPLSSGPALAIGTLDQEALPGDGNVAFFGFDGYQTFTAGLTGLLDTVSLYAVGEGDPWNIAIRAAAANAPTGPDLATGSGPSVEGWTNITLTPALPVVAGTQYAIVAKLPTPSWQGAVAYAGGDSNNPFIPDGDLAFRTFVTLPKPPITAVLVESMVAAAEAGPFGESLMATTGSTLWRRIRVVNAGETALTGLSIVDSGGVLPGSCPPVPTSLAVGGSYVCAFNVPVAGGLTTYTTTATSGNATSTAHAYVTAPGAPVAVGSKLGPPSSAGDYTPTTKVANVGGYVSWLADLGQAAGGKTVGVFASRKGSDGTWGAWSKLTSRTADASGTVSFSRRELTPAWLSIRFSVDDVSFTPARQARWR